MIGIDTTALVAWEMANHADRLRVQTILERETNDGTRFLIAPQVFAEFVHVVTDAKRFEIPLDVETALARAEWWQKSVDVIVPQVTPQVFDLFFEWMKQHRLGRKRILDTLLAATYFAYGSRRVLTLNEADFKVFGEFEFVQ
jgi:predicted nucleic acid-binding protein